MKPLLVLLILLWAPFAWTADKSFLYEDALRSPESEHAYVIAMGIAESYFFWVSKSVGSEIGKGYSFHLGQLAADGNLDLKTPIKIFEVVGYSGPMLDGGTDHFDFISGKDGISGYLQVEKSKYKEEKISGDGLVEEYRRDRSNESLITQGNSVLVLAERTLNGKEFKVSALVTENPLTGHWPKKGIVDGVHSEWRTAFNFLSPLYPEAVSKKAISTLDFPRPRDLRSESLIRRFLNFCQSLLQGN